MQAHRHLQSFSPTHHCYAVGPRTLDVLQQGDAWSCIEVSVDGLAGTELAQGSTADEALNNGLKALQAQH